MNVYKLNPLQDPRWTELVRRHPSSSVFHTVEWLSALRSTYGYEPIVYTTTPPSADLQNGLVFCRIKSWVSGLRLVSLPFSDHCQPLIDDPEVMGHVLGWLEDSQRRENWKYIEVRPFGFSNPVPFVNGNVAPAEKHSVQVLDLRPDSETLFQNFHKSCIQRKIHKAEREKLTYEEGQTDALLAKFYALLLLTRRRHGLPPQPVKWFRNLLAFLGNKAAIRVVSKGDIPVASIFTIFHKNALVYKYGCSDARFNNLGGTPLLFWKAIQDGKRNGVEYYDLGRSESGNPGLITFKENWGAKSYPLLYYRLPADQPALARWHTHLMKSVFSKMPDALLTATGKLLYRHIG